MALEEVARDCSPLLIIYKDGRVERLVGNDFAPVGVDAQTGVESRDVVISPEVAVRLYRPPNCQGKKLPVLVYIHGGGFCIERAVSPFYHTHLNALVAKANAVAVSVDYRRTPEHPMPIPYDDSWTALKWIGTHAAGKGPEQWLNENVDFSKVFIAGDSAGANIAHHMTLRFGTDGVDGIKLKGLMLVHPYFWGSKPIGQESTYNEDEKRIIEQLWYVAKPNLVNLDEPWINPEYDQSLGRLGTERVAVYVADYDALQDRGRSYVKSLQRSDWKGNVELVETEKQPHVFHLFNPTSDEATKFVNTLAEFINRE